MIKMLEVFILTKYKMTSIALILYLYEMMDVH